MRWNKEQKTALTLALALSLPCFPCERWPGGRDVIGAARGLDVIRRCSWPGCHLEMFVAWVSSGDARLPVGTGLALFPQWASSSVLLCDTTYRVTGALKTVLLGSCHIKTLKSKKKLTLFHQLRKR